MLSYNDLETGSAAVYGNAFTGNDVNNGNPRFYSVDGVNPPVLLATSSQFTWWIMENPTGGGRRKG